MQRTQQAWNNGSQVVACVLAGLAVLITGCPGRVDVRPEKDRAANTSDADTPDDSTSARLSWESTPGQAEMVSDKPGSGSDATADMNFRVASADADSAVGSPLNDPPLPVAIETDAITASNPIPPQVLPPNAVPPLESPQQLAAEIPVGSVIPPQNVSPPSLPAATLPPQLTPPLEENVNPTATAAAVAVDPPTDLPVGDASPPFAVAVDPPEDSVTAAPAAHNEEDTHGGGHSEWNPEDAAAAVKKNGEIFTGWKPPKLTLVFSGDQDGYLEPCGCAGLENQKGGLSRRHTMIRELDAQGWNVVGLDVGGLVRRLGRQAEIKYRHAVGSLVKLEYGAVAFGRKDLQLGEQVITTAANLEDANPFVSANVALLDFDSGLTRKWVVIQRKGMRVGVTSVLGLKSQEGLGSFGVLEFQDPVEALPDVVAELEKQACDVLVLLSNATLEESQGYAKRFPQFDYVVSAGGAEEPPGRLQNPDAKPQLIEVGRKGMYVTVVGIYEDGTEPKYQKIPLDARFRDSAEMKEMMASYQQELETLGFENLEVRGMAHVTRRKFVGSVACADCHSSAAEVFEQTPHHWATKTLVELDTPRHFDPECLSCHVTGWNPQRYKPYQSGYLGLTQTPDLVANGCENCHGPGSAHVAAETGDAEVTDEEMEVLRAQLRLKIAENEGNKEGQFFGEVVKMCVVCHDTDNSPEFDFQQYWPDVEHHGKD